MAAQRNFFYNAFLGQKTLVLSKCKLNSGHKYVALFGPVVLGVLNSCSGFNYHKVHCHLSCDHSNDVLSLTNIFVAGNDSTINPSADHFIKLPAAIRSISRTFLREPRLLPNRRQTSARTTHLSLPCGITVGLLFTFQAQINHRYWFLQLRSPLCNL